LSQIIDPTLSFNVAYAPYYDGNFFIDSLKVLVSDDCGATFKTIYRNGGAELSTTTSGLGPDNLYEYDAFSPANCNEWREIQIDLSAYAGKYITLKIQNQSGYGNNMFIDDINLSGELISPVDAPGNLTFEASIQPNPAVDIARLKTSSSIEQPVEISLQSVSGQVLWRSKAIIGPSFREHVLPVGNLTAGVYLVKLNAEHGASKVFKLVVQK
jgi:hypothetical protein